MELAIDKKYKQTKVGLIPQDWEVANMFDNSILKARIGWQGLTTAEYLKSGDYFLVTGTDFFDGKIKWETCHFVEEIRYTQDKNIQLKENDILVTKDGTIGKVAFVDKLYLPATLNSGVFVIRPKNNTFLPNFLYYVLKSFYFDNFLNQLVAGSTIQHLYQKDFITFNFVVPPHSEQALIAEALSDTDALISSVEKLIAKKRNIKQAAMQKLLQSKEDWEEKTYGEVFEFLTTATYSRAQLTENDEVHYVHYGDIHTKWNCFLDIPKSSLPTIRPEQANNYNLLLEGDIVMADASEDYAGIGKSVEVKNLGNVKVISGLHTFLLRDKSEVFVDGFKGYIHLSKFVKEQFDRLATGLKVYGISKANLKRVKIPVPAKEEQTRISNTLSDMDAEIIALETKLEKYRRIKLGMMQNLLTGKIRLV